MIVITGVGRSGTSFLAQLYRELGFDPGGRWLPAMNAGFEDDAVVEANELVAGDLGLRFLGGPGPGADGLVERVRRTAFGRSPHRFDTVDSRRVPATIARHGERLRTIAGARLVAKDPRFCWTLGVWLAAGASIEHVVISTRSMDAVIASRRAAGHLRFRSETAATSELVYALGLCVEAVTDHVSPHTFVRFPQVLDALDDVVTRLPFPERRDPDAVIAAAHAVARRDLVHDWR